jgi:hypothetical protein
LAIASKLFVYAHLLSIILLIVTANQESWFTALYYCTVLSVLLIEYRFGLILRKNLRKFFSRVRPLSLLLVLVCIVASLALWFSSASTEGYQYAVVHSMWHLTAFVGVLAALKLHYNYSFLASTLLLWPPFCFCVSPERRKQIKTFLESLRTEYAAIDNANFILTQQGSPKSDQTNLLSRKYKPKELFCRCRRRRKIGKSPSAQVSALEFLASSKSSGPKQLSLETET